MTTQTMLTMRLSLENLAELGSLPNAGEGLVGRKTVTAGAGPLRSAAGGPVRSLADKGNAGRYPLTSCPSPPRGREGNRSLLGFSVDKASRHHFLQSSNH